MKRSLGLLLGLFLVWMPARGADALDPLGVDRSDELMYFCCAADDQYFECLINLIGSIHHFNWDELGEIAVFDIGFTFAQRKELEGIDKVHVYDIEMTNPDLLKKFRARGGTRNVPGWYAWKPVAIKQALEKFPCIMYLDAGIELRKKLNGLFKAIRENGYVLLQSIRSITWMSTKYVMENFVYPSELRDVLAAESSKGILAGLQGLTRAYYESYVLPVYELTHDMRNFAEDGSTRTARHDQPLFSIWAYKNGMKSVTMHEKRFEDAENGSLLSFNDMFRLNVRSRGRQKLPMIPYIRRK